LFNWISKCGNFPSFVFSPKYGLIADVARNKPPKSRFKPVTIRTKLSAKISPSSLKDRAVGLRTGSSANTSMIFLSFCSASQEPKQKGQPHREDSTAKTQRNPTPSSRTPASLR
jgi:hypothetical protein